MLNCYEPTKKEGSFKKFMKIRRITCIDWLRNGNECMAMLNLNNKTFNIHVIHFLVYYIFCFVQLSKINYAFLIKINNLIRKFYVIFSHFCLKSIRNSNYSMWGCKTSNNVFRFYRPETRGRYLGGKLVRM